MSLTLLTNLPKSPPNITGTSRIAVAVGTTIPGRPSHRSVRARLRIPLLRRVSGVEAIIRMAQRHYLGDRYLRKETAEQVRFSQIDDLIAPPA